MNSSIFNLRILSLDVALANTGFCCFNVSVEQKNFKIVKFGSISTDDTGAASSKDTDSRIRFILHEVDKLMQAHGINALIAEEPSVVFGAKEPGFALASRAHGVIACAKSFGAIIGYAHATGKYCRTVHPHTWQVEMYHKKGSSKQRSINDANQILKYLGLPKLGTNHHAADAINIGIFGVKKFLSQTWHIPSAVEIQYD